jgi:TolB-like protein/Flp pilus assembly protein TadD
MAKIASGDCDAGVAALEEAARLARRGGFILGVLGWGLAAAGRHDEARAVLDELRARSHPAPTVVAEAWILAELGDTEGAWEVLARAEDEAQAILYFTGLPSFDPLRADPSFAALLERLGLPPSAEDVRDGAQSIQTTTVDSGAMRADEGFWVAVLPFMATGGDNDLTALADGLSEDIVTGLSRFSYLRVIARSSTLRFASEGIDVRAIGKELSARYVMKGSLRQAGKKLRVVVQLVDTDSGTHLWAETFDRDFPPEELFALQDDLVQRIVSAVGDAHGILPHSMSESLRGKAPDRLSPYEAVLRSFGYGYRRTPEEHAAVRAALERAVQEAPRYADVGRALQAARRAADAAPSNAMAFNSLAWAMFFRKEFQLFRNAAEQSIALNPLNSPTLAGLGALTAYAGDWVRGCALVERALELNPRHPGWYWLPLFYDAYRRGDYRGAVDIALKINLPEFFVMHEALAAAYGQLGERDAAGKALREMLRLKADYDATGREICRTRYGRTPQGGTGGRFRQGHSGPHGENGAGSSGRAPK